MQFKTCFGSELIQIGSHFYLVFTILNKPIKYSKHVKICTIITQVFKPLFYELCKLFDDNILYNPFVRSGLEARLFKIIQDYSDPGGSRSAFLAVDIWKQNLSNYAFVTSVSYNLNKCVINVRLYTNSKYLNIETHDR